MDGTKDEKKGYDRNKYLIAAFIMYVIVYNHFSGRITSNLNAPVYADSMALLPPIIALFLITFIPTVMMIRNIKEKRSVVLSSILLGINLFFTLAFGSISIKLLTIVLAK